MNRLTCTTEKYEDELCCEGVDIGYEKRVGRTSLHPRPVERGRQGETEHKNLEQEFPGSVVHPVEEGAAVPVVIVDHMEAVGVQQVEAGEEGAEQEGRAEHAQKKSRQGQS